MERKIYINPNSNNGQSNISNYVYINRNFGCNSIVNQTAPNVVTTQPHINPLFNANRMTHIENIRNELSKHLYYGQNDYTQNLKEHYQSNPRIHINPMMLDIINKKSAEVKIDHSVSKCVPKNKFKKINPPKPVTAPNSNVNSQPPLHSIPIVKKPSRTLIRNPISKPISSNVLALRKPKYQIIRANSILLHRQMYTPKSNSRVKVNFNSSKRKINPKVLNKSTNKLINKVSVSSLPMHSMNYVFIGGEKYVLNKGLLKRVINSTHQIINANSKPKIKQICVLGKVFVRKSDNLFVENSKGIPRKMNKINIPCSIYRRLGLCIRHKKGKCPLVHDPKHIAICRKFLQGLCKIDGCHLSHQVTSEKMPTCTFFLEGCCLKNDCPYLHVKINEDADVCAMFLQGYCAAGKDCDKLHIHVCPEFYKLGQCNKPKCSYSHKNIKKPSLKNHSKYKVTPRSEPNLKNFSDVDDSNSRYYLSSSKENVRSEKITPDEINNTELTKNDDQTPIAFNNRPKLGNLPSFIAL